jgi:hypothetical protein
MDQDTGLAAIDRQPSRATLRSFGVALALLCVGRAAWSWTDCAYNAVIVSAGIAAALACIALFLPSKLRGLYVLLGVLSYPLRWLLSYLVLAVVYFGVITPVALGVRLARRLRSREITKQRSNWRVSPPRGDKPSYFRQF